MVLYHGVITDGIYFTSIFYFVAYFLHIKHCVQILVLNLKTAENTTAELAFHPITFSLCRKQVSTEETQDISEAEVSFLKA